MAFLIQRNGNYSIQYSVGKRSKRKSLRTKSKQIAEEMLRQFKSAEYQGLSSPLPTKTHISEVVGAYVRKMRATKTERSVKADIQCLRAIFGECCEELEYSVAVQRFCVLLFSLSDFDFKPKKFRVTTT